MYQDTEVMEGQETIEYKVNLPRLEIKFLSCLTHSEDWWAGVNGHVNVLWRVLGSGGAGTCP